MRRENYVGNSIPKNVL